MAYWYEQREKSLRRMGYACYADYLSSRCWRATRNCVLNRCKGVCEVCRKEKATQVHHRSYCLATMRGKRKDFLVACCRGCHEEAEFSAGRKTSPREANARMAEVARGNGHVLFGICQVCQKNPTSKRKIVCGKCKREAREALASGG